MQTNPKALCIRNPIERRFLMTSQSIQHPGFQLQFKGEAKSGKGMPKVAWRPSLA
jgi:hypothetical protein